jgi:hypothetical protein
MQNIMKFKCLKCGHEWETRAVNIMNYGCRYCKDLKRQKTHEEFVKEVYDLVGDEYIILEHYPGNNKKKFLMKHNKCGCEYYITANAFLRGHRCPDCKQSKGEEKIKQSLDILNIKYTSQNKYQNCKYKRLLPFDILVTNKLLIEFDGKQHYEPVKTWGGEKQLKIIQMRDDIKNNYCKQNHIPLLRIPYWEFDNIEEILNVVLRYLHIVVDNKKEMTDQDYAYIKTYLMENK